MIELKRIGMKVVLSLLLGLVAFTIAFGLYWLIGLDRSSLISVRAIAPLIGVSALMFIVNKLPFAWHRGQAITLITHRDILQAIALVIVLLLVWGLMKNIVSWMIAPNIYDNGPCSEYSYSSCGSGDLNDARRESANSIVDNIAGVLLLIMPLSLLLPAVRKRFISK